MLWKGLIWTWEQVYEQRDTSRSCSYVPLCGAHRVMLLLSARSTWPVLSGCTGISGFVVHVRERYIDGAPTRAVLPPCCCLCSTVLEKTNVPSTGPAQHNNRLFDAMRLQAETQLFGECSLTHFVCVLDHTQ